MVLQRTDHSSTHWWTQQSCLVSWYQACLLLLALSAGSHVSVNSNNAVKPFKRHKTGRDGVCGLKVSLLVKEVRFAELLSLLHQVNYIIIEVSVRCGLNVLVLKTAKSEQTHKNCLETGMES